MQLPYLTKLYLARYSIYCFVIIYIYIYFLSIELLCFGVSSYLNLFDLTQVKEALGGKVRLILSGAAPLASHVETFLRVVACCYVLQGYGMLFWVLRKASTTLSLCSFLLKFTYSYL